MPERTTDRGVEEILDRYRARGYESIAAYIEQHGTHLASPEPDDPGYEHWWNVRTDRSLRLERTIVSLCRFRTTDVDARSTIGQMRVLSTAGHRIEDLEEVPCRLPGGGQGSLVQPREEVVVSEAPR